MSNRGKNFRRRAEDDGDDDSSDKANGGVAAATARPQSKPTTVQTAASKPKKLPALAPKSLLSFAEDEDGDSPTSRPLSKTQSSSRFAKTSSASHKMTSAKDRLASSSSSLPSNVQPQAGTYTKEALLELQKNTKTLAGSRLPPSREVRKPSSEPRIILKGLLKPTVTSDPVSETVKEIEDSESDEEGPEKRANLFRREKDDATSRLGSMGIGKGRDLPGSSFPDQATIDAIRAKRERLRQSRAAAPDFIALDTGSNHGAAEGLSDEEPEFQGRIGFFGDKINSGKKGVFEEVDGSAMDVGLRKESELINDAVDEEDEEDKIWEEEQFRKALGKRMDDGPVRAVTSSVPVAQNVQQQKLAYPSVATAHQPVPNVPAVPSIGGAMGPFPGLDVMSLAQQAEIARKALHENVARLKESHSRTMTSLTRTDENLSTSLVNIVALENSLSAAGEKFIFMQKLRDFVSVICDFLQDKAPYIEELEVQMHELHKERATAVIQRRLADNKDEMKGVEAAVNAAMSVFNRGGSSAPMVEAATNAAKAAAAATRELDNLPVELDEFGRDKNLQKRMDVARRAEERKRRRAQSDSKRMSSMEYDSYHQKIEGESSTDESDTESTAYQSNRDQLLQVAEQIFSDASEEYSQLSVVIERFETCKREYASSYLDAYISESVSHIFSPYVRLELLKWDPLHEDVDFIAMNWHSLLFNYGLSDDESKINLDDADANLIPALVEKVAIPILHNEIENCWDMLSTRETKHAVAATNLIFRYVPLPSKAVSELVALICDRLAFSVADLKIPTWNTLVLKAVPNAARIAAYRFGMSVRLMRNICMWNKILALPVLEKLALDDLLSGKVLPHLRSIQSNVHDAVTRTERIIASLSGVWAGPSVTGERSPKLQLLVDYLLMLGRTLGKKSMSGATEPQTAGLVRRLKKMLVELNEYDHARQISRTFNLKEAL